jgi:protoporphyrinogen oxidase
MTAQPGTAVILGAGPAGLAAGYALSRAGWLVQVYEQASMVGGLSRTERHGDFRFDIGGHRWFTKKDELNHFLIDLLDDELILVDRTSRIYFDGKYVDYPLRIGNALSRIGPATSVRAISDFIVSQGSRVVAHKPVVSMEDAYVAQFGRTLYEIFFKRYSEKLWGRDCTELSGDWVAQRSKGLSLFTAVRDAIRPSEGKVESLVERFMYPRLGYGRICERMAEEIERFGGTVHLGWRAIEVEHDRGRIVGVTLSDGKREQVVGGDAFVSTIPMTELVHDMRPSADAAAREATAVLTYRDVVTVNVMLNRSQLSPDTWLYVHDPSVCFSRLHEPRNWSKAMAPAGKTSVVLEVFCDVGDTTWQRSDEEICRMAVEDLVEKLHFAEKNEVIEAFAIRSRDAYPRYGLQYRQAVETVKQYIGSFSNLAIAGRGGTFRYFNADHAIETGLLAARNVLGDSVDVDSVNSEQEYLEERRVPVGALASSGHRLRD